MEKAKESFGSYANQEIPTKTELQLAKSMLSEGEISEEQYEELKSAHEAAMEAERDAFGTGV